MSLPKLWKNPPKLSLVLRLSVVAVCLVLAVTQFSWLEIKEAFARLSLSSFAFALFLFLVGQVIIGFRWWLLLRTQNIRISPYFAVKLHLLGHFYNNIMPSALGGDFVRAGYVTMHTDKKVAAFISVFVDRLVGLISTLSIAITCYFIFMSGQTYPQGQGSKPTNNWLGIALALSLALLIVLVILTAIFPKGRLLLKKGLAFMLIKIKMVLMEFVQSVKLYCRKPHLVLAAILVTVGLQLMIITGLSIIGSDLGIALPLNNYYFFFAVSWVVGAVPISIGGLGVVEGSIIFLFHNIGGAERGAVVALALCQRLIWLMASLPGAVVHGLGAHLPAEFSIDEDKTIT